MTPVHYLLGRIEGAINAAQDAMIALDPGRDLIGREAAERLGQAKAALRMVALDLEVLAEELRLNRRAEK